VTDLAHFAGALAQVQDMLTRVLGWVRRVRAGGAPADAALGRFLLDALGGGPEADEGASLHTTLQDTLMVSYLANLVRAQAEVSARLALVS
jgi:translation initiation factor 3 subunit F